MRISEVDKITPRGGPRRQPAVTTDPPQTADHVRIWQDLAPRLIHPTKIRIIEALSWIGEPLSASDLFAVLAPSESSVDYVRYHLRGLIRAGVVIHVPDLAIDDPREPRCFFNSSQVEDSDEKAKSGGTEA